ncbi:hypothetical protein CJ010_10930 [Azoarcus sp. DD4]|nr:hypothetical protein CJ010_10930 [Azoarcus sp. DD4]
MQCGFTSNGRAFPHYHSLVPDEPVEKDVLFRNASPKWTLIKNIFDIHPQARSLSRPVRRNMRLVRYLGRLLMISSSPVEFL